MLNDMMSLTIQHPQWSGERVIITAHKRSLGQGNVFTPVCHSLCSLGGGGGAVLRGCHP